MTGTSLNELNRMIGKLIASTEGIEEDLKAIRQEMRESEKASSESRRGMHQRLDQVVDRTGHLESEMQTVKHELHGVKAVTDKVTMWEQRGIGAIAMTGIGASALTFGLTHWWSEIMRALGRG